MINILGAILVLVASVLYGRYGAARLKIHKELLSDVQQRIAALVREIDYLAAPLPKSLQQAAACAGLAHELFERSSILLNQGDGISGGEAWQQALCEQRYMWQEDEYAVLMDVADGLGEMDSRLQLRQLELVRQRLNECEKRADSHYQRMGKIWNSMGWCVGAVIVLIMI